MTWSLSALTDKEMGCWALEYNLWNERHFLLLKVILLSALVVGITILVLRNLPRVRFYAQKLLQNPIMRATLLRGLWRLVQLLIFRR